MVRTFLQAFAIVFLTATNVSNIVSGRYVMAFITGCGISGLWWHLSRSTRPIGWQYHLCYTLGAGCGTLAGMFIGRL